VDSLATAADRTYLQGMGAAGIVFSPISVLRTLTSYGLTPAGAMIRCRRARFTMVSMMHSLARALSCDTETGNSGMSWPGRIDPRAV